MIYPTNRLIPIMSTLSPTFEATLTTCRMFTKPESWCQGCYLVVDKGCGATFTNPDWQASLDQLKLTNPEFFI